MFWNVIRTASATIPFSHVVSANDTKGSVYGHQFFYNRCRSNVGPQAPEVSVLTTEVYRDSISYWNKIADISVFPFSGCCFVGTLLQ